MQTLEPDVPVARSARHAVALVAAAVAAIVATAAITWVLASGSRTTRTIVKTVSAAKPATPKLAAALSCVPGAAAGSCNIDEAAELAIPDKPLDPATRALLAKQLVAARAVAAQYPTVADAEKAGFLQAGKFSPTTGAHFINEAGLGAFDPTHPGSFIYDGISPTSKIVGLMYLAQSTGPPEGFAGPNDHWHRHTNTCVIFGGAKIVVPFAADSSVTRAQCDAVGGQFMRTTSWMVHAWVVPGWESPLGVFSHNNSNVKCADGTLKTNAAGFCRGT